MISLTEFSGDVKEAIIIFDTTLHLAYFYDIEEFSFVTLMEDKFLVIIGDLL